MPATNGALSTPAGASATSTGYLRAQRPAWAMLQTALTVFALAVIARHCLRSLSAWWRGPAHSRHRVAADGLEAQQHWALADEKPRGAMEDNEDAPPPAEGPTAVMRGDGNCRGGADSLPRPLVPRLPPAPPLTPPELSSAIFTIDDVPPHRQHSFIHQPNPDYMASTSIVSSHAADSPSRPRRRSYNRTVPVGTPVPAPQTALPLPLPPPPPPSSHAGPALPPSSYPPTSPRLLRPAPPARAATADGGRGVDVKGEIISVLDDGGAGWTRHTRVYGGGVCLACAAAGANHHAGGFYGATVSPEEMMR